MVKMNFFKIRHLIHHLKDNFILIENDLRTIVSESTGKKLWTTEIAIGFKKTYFVLLGMPVQWNLITIKMTYKI